MPVVLTDRVIAKEPHCDDGQRILRDAQLKGFFVLIGKRSKAFMIQSDLRNDEERKTIRMKLGRVEQLTTREARAKARLLLGQIAKGNDPRPKATSDTANGNDPSLKQAWEDYRDGHMRRKGRSEKTIAGYADSVNRLMKPWLDNPLSYLGHHPAKVRAYHSELTRESGPYSAKTAMRTLRAIYNHARKVALDLPSQNPAFAVDWNPEYRRNSGMGLEDLPQWFDQLSKLDNSLRRELHLFLLLSGSRPAAIRTAKIEYIDFAKREFFIPNPKGGADRAFSIPLSRQMVLCLVRTIRLGRMMFPANDTWLFPADSEAGHVIEHKERRKVLSYWGNELKQSYRTIGQIAGIADIDMHLLMNHSLPGVNAGYITRSKLVYSHLRQAQQKISDTMMGMAGVSKPR